MEKYGEIYTAYEWHVVDPDSGRIVVYLQNRRDHPGGKGTIDFPGVTILEYAGGDKFRLEEDFYSIRGRDVAMQPYRGRAPRSTPSIRRKDALGLGLRPRLDARVADVRGAQARPVQPRRHCYLCCRSEC
jgi:hypothetical protein